MAETGRFTSEDPWKGTIIDPKTLNPYPYVQNNPLKYIDPTGMVKEMGSGGEGPSRVTTKTSSPNIVNEVRKKVVKKEVNNVSEWNCRIVTEGTGETGTNWTFTPVPDNVDASYDSMIKAGVPAGYASMAAAGLRDANATYNATPAMSRLYPWVDTYIDINEASTGKDILYNEKLSTFDDVSNKVGLALSVLGIDIVDDIADIKRATQGAGNAAEATINTARTVDLNTTHKITMSKNKFNQFVEIIKNEGIQEPIKYVEYNGQKFVVDGHHRLQAAKQLGIKDVPVQKVELPFRGYNSTEDLFWGD